MPKAYVLYNLKAGYDTTVEDVRPLEVLWEQPLEFIEISQIESYEAFFSRLQQEDAIILCGGDGTLNRFANATAELNCPCEIYCCPLGTGNDFAADLGYFRGCNPFPITNALQNLPTVTVNGRSYRFLNGVGFGIDGYCCETGDAQKRTSGKKVNYTAIAIKGLLFHYRPRNAVVTVDGVRHSYRHVWLAPAMYGRHYGGGMIPTPEQNRTAPSGTLSVMVYHCPGKLKALMVFPSIFQGTHVRHTKTVEILTGREIRVEFDRPTPLQIDGETISGVTSYIASAAPKEELH